MKAPRMADTSGTDLLKRHIESSLIQRWIGDAQDILDVGCGTGRLLDEAARRHQAAGELVQDPAVRALHPGGHLHGDDGPQSAIRARPLPA